GLEMEQLAFANVTAAIALLKQVSTGHDGPTVRQLWDDFFAANKHLKSLVTYAEKSRHVLRVFGDRVASTLCLADIDRFRANRRREITRRGLPPTVATVNREIALLRRILNFAVERGKIAFSPIAA